MQPKSKTLVCRFFLSDFLGFLASRHFSDNDSNPYYHCMKVVPQIDPQAGASLGNGGHDFLD